MTQDLAAIDRKRALRAARLTELRRFARRFFRNPLGVLGLFIVLALLFTAAFAPWLATHDPYHAQPRRPALPPPMRNFWFGADELGRDIYSRIVYGSRLTLLIVGLVIVTSAPDRARRSAPSRACSAAGSTRVFMRVTDVFLAVPKLLLALAFVAALGPGIVNAALAITLTAWPPYARLARAEALIVRNSDYVNAVPPAPAPASCASSSSHIIPMCLLAR